MCFFSFVQHALFSNVRRRDSLLRLADEQSSITQFLSELSLERSVTTCDSPLHREINATASSVSSSVQEPSEMPDESPSSSNSQLESMSSSSLVRLCRTCLLAYSAWIPCLLFQKITVFCLSDFLR